jgi:hypothetical protein
VKAKLLKKYVQDYHMMQEKLHYGTTLDQLQGEHISLPLNALKQLNDKVATTPVTSADAAVGSLHE